MVKSVNWGKGVEECKCSDGDVSPGRVVMVDLERHPLAGKASCGPYWGVGQDVGRADCRARRSDFTGRRAFVCVLFICWDTESAVASRWR